MVVHDRQRNTVYIVHSGTDLDRRATEDLVTDGFITANQVKESARYKSSKKIAETVSQQYEGARIVHAGYSLGGALALHLGHELGQESFSFNPGVSPFAALKVGKFGPERFPNQQHIFVTKQDWISASGALLYPDAEIHTPDTNAPNPHSIDNYLNDQLVRSEIA
jgi:hypothetical protein